MDSVCEEKDFFLPNELVELLFLTCTYPWHYLALLRVCKRWWYVGSQVHILHRLFYNDVFTKFTLKRKLEPIHSSYMFAVFQYGRHDSRIVKPFIFEITGNKKYWEITWYKYTRQDMRPYEVNRYMKMEFRGKEPARYYYRRPRGATKATEVLFHSRGNMLDHQLQHHNTWMLYIHAEHVAERYFSYLNE